MISRWSCECFGRAKGKVCFGFSVSCGGKGSENERKGGERTGEVMRRNEKCGEKRRKERGKGG